MNIIVDFDGTCVTHNHPVIGKEIGAAPVLKELVAHRHNLILFTMRGSGKLSVEKFGRDGLKDAVDWFKKHQIPLYGIQSNPTQHHWTNSPKAHGHLIIDDICLGIPLCHTKEDGVFVDWLKVVDLLSDTLILPLNKFEKQELKSKILLDREIKLENEFNMDDIINNCHCGNDNTEFGFCPTCDTGTIV